MTPRLSRRALIPALSLTLLPGVIVFAAPAGTALADVCASAGRRISVSGCANIADAVNQYAPPPTYYAPLPDDPPPPPPGSNVSGCIGYNGRWVHANGCN